MTQALGCVQGGDDDSRGLDGWRRERERRTENHGKRFFLKLAADSVSDVNTQRDKGGLSYARKARIGNGM